eukprot:6176851-Pleurochrysis_carterae.AAC.3
MKREMIQLFVRPPAHCIVSMETFGTYKRQPLCAKRVRLAAAGGGRSITVFCTFNAQERNIVVEKDLTDDDDYWTTRAP